MDSFGVDMIENRLRAASDGRERRLSEAEFERNANREQAELERLVRETEEMSAVLNSAKSTAANRGKTSYDTPKVCLFSFSTPFSDHATVTSLFRALNVRNLLQCGTAAIDVG